MKPVKTITSRMLLLSDKGKEAFFKCFRNLTVQGALLASAIFTYYMATTTPQMLAPTIFMGLSFLLMFFYATFINMEAFYKIGFHLLRKSTRRAMCQLRGKNKK